MNPVIFYSWQSDVRPGAACRTMIQDALEAAAKSIAADGTLGIEPVIDRDTYNVPGSPDIGHSILAKIEAASVFVADVTIIGSVASRPTPNPNVLVEVGFALKALGWERVVLVQNTALGPPENLPFDLRQKRAITYESPPDASERALVRRGLQADLERALKAILATPKRAAEIELSLEYAKRHVSPESHVYELVVAFRNISTRRLDDWALEIEVPTPLLTPTKVAARVPERSDEHRTLFRFVGGAATHDSLWPGAAVTPRIAYMVTGEIHRRRDTLFGELMEARALVDGAIVAEVARSVESLQEF